ncbi:MFS transporter [Paraburkholderia sacchari]|nr:MFS transporter [Paraburkholderia sacchari]
MGSTSDGLGENNWAKSIVLVSGPALVTLVPMAAAPAMPAMAAHFAHGTDGALFAQLVMTVPAVALILCAPLAGIVAEIVGRRLVMMVGLLSFVLAGTAVLFLDSPTALIVSRLLLGAAGGAIQTCCLSLVGDYPTGGHRERLLGFMVAASSATAMVALMAGGHLVDRAGWRTPFALYAFGVPFLLMAPFCIKAHKHIATSEHNIFSPFRTMWPIYLLASALTIGMFMPSIQGPFLLQEQGVGSAEVQGTVTAACALVAALAAASFGFIGRFLGSRGVLMLTTVCFGVGALGMSLAHGAFLIGCASAVMGIGAGLVEATCATMIMSRAPLSMRSRATGLLLSAIFLGQFLNPWVVGPIRVLCGIDKAFMVVGILFLCLAGMILMGRTFWGPWRGERAVRA